MEDSLIIIDKIFFLSMIYDILCEIITYDPYTYLWCDPEIDDHINRVHGIDWDHVSQYSSLTLDAFKRYRKYINYYLLRFNHKADKEIFVNYKDQIHITCKGKEYDSRIPVCYNYKMISNTPNELYNPLCEQRFIELTKNKKMSIMRQNDIFRYNTSSDFLEYLIENGLISPRHLRNYHNMRQSTLIKYYKQQKYFVYDYSRLCKDEFVLNIEYIPFWCLDKMILSHNCILKILPIIDNYPQTEYEKKYEIDREILVNVTHLSDTEKNDIKDFCHNIKSSIRIIF